jgi:hypothetical protein
MKQMMMMKHVHKILIEGILICLAAQAAFAQQGVGAKAGPVEVGIPVSEQELRLTVKETRTLRTATETETGRYFGRASLQVLRNGTWVMTYIHSFHHWRYPHGQIVVMFSKDEGRTWLPPNTFIDGTPVEGLPSAPSPKESPYDPVEPYIYLAPNGDLLISAMDVDIEARKSNGTDWFTRSTNGGKTWGPWTQTSQAGVPPPFKEHSNDMTQQCFVKDGVMYASSRASDMTQGNSVPALFKSADNGKTWEFVNFIGKVKGSADGLYHSEDCESGIELVGPKEIVAILRHGMWPAPTHMTRSHDMGKTWSEAKDISGTTKFWKRPRIYTLRHLRQMSGAEDISDWWNDSVLIGTGPIQLESQLRNVGLWYSMDKGETWSTPLYCDKDTQDAGYGDMRMRKNGELVVVSYFGRFDAADIKQYVVGIEFVKKATLGASVNH